MLYLITGIITRIVSNSYLNVFQKLLTNKGQKSSVINFYTYLGLSLMSIWFLQEAVSTSIIPLALGMGILGALGNYFIIKALSIGELSTIAPINSYKPVVALIFGTIFLKEIPSVSAVFAILLIILGTYVILNSGKCDKKALFYRIIALICSGSEAVIIKKIIVLTSPEACFGLWALTGLLFSAVFVLFAKHKPVIKDYKYQLLLILSVGIMQYSTNFVFAKMNVAYALALFQLSTLLSVFLGVNIFNEKNLKKKVIGSIIMISGAVILLLN